MGFFGLKKNKKNDKEAVKEEVIQTKNEASKKATDSGTVEKSAPVVKSSKPATTANKAAPLASEESKKGSKPAASKPAVDKTTETKKTASEKKTEAKATTAPVKKTTAKTQSEPKAKAAKKEETTVAPVIEEKNSNTAYTGRFEINKSKDGSKYFFNLYASNSVGIATSQMYSTAQSALNGVKSVIANADKAPIEDQSLKNYETLPYPKWEIYVDNGGKYRFRLNASNGNCVCHSQGYTTKNACKNGIDSIIRSSKNAIIDKTYITK